MKEAYYFSHDANARQDEKILMLRADHGWEGYGIYWALVEMMFESKETALHHSKIKGIAVSYNIDMTLLKNVIETCVKEELFKSDGDRFWSETLVRRKEKFLNIRDKKSEAGKKGAAKRWENQGFDGSAMAEPLQSHGGAITENSKGKESKVNKSKEKERESSPKQVYDESSLYFKMATFFYEQIKQNNPDHKRPNMQKWSDDLRKTVELDKRDKDEVGYLIKWVQQHDFWQANVLSPSKLREKYDQLMIQYKKGAGKGYGNVHQFTPRYKKHEYDPAAEAF